MSYSHFLRRGSVAIIGHFDVTSVNELAQLVVSKVTTVLTGE
jgi:hypothetical protein